MKIAIVYSSIHHRNTEKLLHSIESEVKIDLIKAGEVKKYDLSSYDIIGIASGIYMGKCHEQVLRFIEESPYLTSNKKVFLLLTSGSNSKKYGLTEQVALENKHCKFLGTYRCKGYDTYGIFKLFGGIAKGHPNTEDKSKAIKFVKDLI